MDTAPGRLIPADGNAASVPVVLPTAVCPDAPVVRVLFEAEEAWPSVRGPLVAVAGAAIALVAATAVAVGPNGFAATLKGTDVTIAGHTG